MAVLGIRPMTRAIRPTLHVQRRADMAMPNEVIARAIKISLATGQAGSPATGSSFRRPYSFVAFFAAW